MERLTLLMWRKPSLEKKHNATDVASEMLNIIEITRECIPEFSTFYIPASKKNGVKEAVLSKVNRTPSRGQRKNIKFSRPAAIRCWPLFMRRGKACAFPSASGHPDCAGHVLCCNSEYTAGSSEQARAC